MVDEMTDSAHPAILPAKLDYDVIICGAGPVGMTVAALLYQHSKSRASPPRIALIDAKTAATAHQDPRTIALSQGSQQILDNIGVWSMLAQAASPIHHIHVSRRGHFGRTLIRREDYHLPALGHVVRYGPLVSALSAALTRTRATILQPMKVVGISEQPEHAIVQLEDERSITAAVVIQAEGGVFAEQTARKQQRDYEQIAIIAHVHVSVPIAHRAFERFTAEGPLALLPQEDGYALVWCVRPATAERLLGMDEHAFLPALGEMFGDRMGRFTHCSSRIGYPLGLNAQAAASPHTVAIGNAAQTLHPVAGQGLNLGLRDATVLAHALLQQGFDSVALKLFEKQRQGDRHATIRLTDLMARVFASAPDGSLRQSLLGLSLGVIDIVAPAKRLLAEQMMFGWR